MTLKIGYDLFAGASQAGYNSAVPGVIQVETTVALKHCLRIVRLSDNYYYNATSKAFQAGAPAEADELVIPGSDDMNPNAVRRLKIRIPKEAQDAITSAGFIATAYGTGLTPSGGVAMTLVFQP